MIERLGNLCWLITIIFLFIGLTASDWDDGFVMAALFAAIAYVCRGFPWKRHEQAEDD